MILRYTSRIPRWSIFSDLRRPTIVFTSDSLSTNTACGPTIFRRKNRRRRFRVLVIGDSVIYGGVRIDQVDIDTEILKRNLQKELGRPVIVGNASAKSWGPPNELAYLERFGTLQADVVILELSSHDYADAPTFAPVVGIAAAYPGKKPLLAVTDLLKTYLLPRYLHIGDTAEGVDRTLPDAPASP